jgi:putative FmdB family regulatory protein
MKPSFYMRNRGEKVSYYNYICEECGEITLDLKLGTAKEIEICPNCGKEIKRSYSPIGNVWKCNGAYGKVSK